MLEEIFEEINNDFAITCETVSVVVDGAAKTITTEYVKEYVAGKYIRLVGTILNNGTYKLASVAEGVLTVEETLTDETRADATLRGLVVPSAVLTLDTDIAAAITKGFSGVAEIQRGDTRIKYGDGSQADTWQGAFRKRLNTYRRMRTL